VSVEWTARSIKGRAQGLMHEMRFRPLVGHWWMGKSYSSTLSWPPLHTPTSIPYLQAGQRHDDGAQDLMGSPGLSPVVIAHNNRVGELKGSTS
jgi:hypothetical protein